MGVSAGKSNTDTTGESNGQSQYQNFGGQQASGSNNGYTDIRYLDPNAIAGQKSRYNGLLDQSQGNTADTFGKASQFYGGLLNSPGYDPGTKNAISAIGNAAANEKLDEGKAAAERHAAATGSDAGYTAGLANLYGSAARDTADRANQNQLAFFNEQQRQRELGGAGMERLFGTAQGAQLGLLGGMNNLSTLGSGTTSGGQYSNTGSQYGNGSATNQNTMHQAGQSTHTGGEGDAANSLDNLLAGLFGKKGGGGAGAGSGGGLGGALGQLAKGLFGGNGITQSPFDSGGLGGLPYGQQNPGFTGEDGYFDENGNWISDGSGMDTNHDGLIDGYDFGGGNEPPGALDGGYQGAPDPGTINWDPFGGGNEPPGALDGGYQGAPDPGTINWDPFGGGLGFDPGQGDGGGYYTDPWEWD